LRLYHRTNYIFLRSLILWLLFIVLSACSTNQISQELLIVTISADNKVYQVKISAGSTVQQALESVQVSLGELDRVHPSLSAKLSSDSEVVVIRIREETYTRQVLIPFSYQELKSEALPEGEKRISQPGENGLQEVTYQRLFENEVEVSNEIINTSTIKEAIPEVVMVGSQSHATPISFPGKLAYLSAGSAWIMEDSTTQRNLVVSTGDLDGRVFSLSKNGNFLLFTRFSGKEYSINKLCIASLLEEPIEIFEVGVENVVHYAEFNPESTQVAYSTADWRETSPGWQANNDLLLLDILSGDVAGATETLIEANSGGMYGWWGNTFSWSPDQSSFLVASPDGIGTIDAQHGTQAKLLGIEPYQTASDWAWVPGAAWSPDNMVIYTVNHALNHSPGMPSSEFNLMAIPLSDGTPINIKHSVGMFAYPVASPISMINEYIDPISGASTPQRRYSVAYLQADFPDESETSKYSLYLIDRDGSNAQRLFPQQSAPGLDPQHVIWSPDVMESSGNYAIALIYNGNIWLIDSGTGVAQQITVDGLIERIDWR
jgi:hypothetical protein